MDSLDESLWAVSVCRHFQWLPGDEEHGDMATWWHGDTDFQKIEKTLVLLHHSIILTLQLSLVCKHYHVRCCTRSIAPTPQTSLSDLPSFEVFTVRWKVWWHGDMVTWWHGFSKIEKALVLLHNSIILSLQLSLVCICIAMWDVVNVVSRPQTSLSDPPSFWSVYSEMKSMVT